MTDANVAKRAAAYAAADLVQDGMTIGLGSGSTFLFVLDRLAERMRADGLKLRGTPTSSTTAEAAEKKGIPLVSLERIGRTNRITQPALHTARRNFRDLVLACRCRLRGSPRMKGLSQ